MENIRIINLVLPRQGVFRRILIKNSTGKDDDEKTTRDEQSKSYLSKAKRGV